MNAVIQSAETRFAAEYFRATVRLVDRAPGAGTPEQVGDGVPPAQLAPATELHGDILFQGQRFQRLGVACMRGPNGRTAPARVPQSLVHALEPYTHRLIRAGS